MIRDETFVDWSIGTESIAMRWLFRKLRWLKPSRRFLKKFGMAVGSLLAGLIALWFAVDWYWEWDWRKALKQFEAEEVTREASREPWSEAPPELRYCGLSNISSGLRDREMFVRVERKASEYAFYRQRLGAVEIASPFRFDGAQVSAVDAVSLRFWRKAFRSSRKFPRLGDTNQPATEVLLALRHWQPELEAVEALAVERRKCGVVCVPEILPRDLNRETAISTLCGLLCLRSEASLDSGKLDDAVSDVQLVGEIQSSIGYPDRWFNWQLPPRWPTIWKGLTCHLWRERDLCLIQSSLARFESRDWTLHLVFERQRESARDARSYHEIRWEGIWQAFRDMAGAIIGPFEDRIRMARDRDVAGLVRSSSYERWHSELREVTSSVTESVRTLFGCLIPAFRIREDIVKLELYRGLRGALGRRWVLGEIGSGEILKEFRCELQRRDLDGDPAIEISEELQRAEFTERQRRLAITACAIERYRIAHLDLPRDLAALNPYLNGIDPIEPSSRKLLIYHPLPNGEYILAGSFDPNSKSFFWRWPTPTFSWLKMYH